MYSSNKILIPFKETNSFPSSINSLVSNYYKEMGYDVFSDGLISEDGGTFIRSSSRNMLANNSSDDILILIDSDTIVTPYAIQQALDICTENDVVVRLATNTISVSDEKEDVINNILNNEIIPQDMFGNPSTRYLHAGCSWVLNRKTWEFLGGFNESFVWYGYEDLEFNLRAARMSKLIFLDYDEYSIKNQKTINLDQDINKNIYETSHSVFYERGKMNMLIRRSEQEADVPHDLVEKIFDYNNYII